MAEHYGNTPRITYEFPDCSMPMAFDTYNNCSFGCMYCFAQNQRGIGSKKKEYLHKEVKDVSVERIKRMFIDPASTVETLRHTSRLARLCSGEA